MDILDSDWLQRMALKAGRKPAARMLALFDIVEDWSAAPGMREHLQTWQPELEDGCALRLFMAQLAREAGAAQPEALASQLCSLLLGALREELRAPEQNALSHAKTAAALLIGNQLQRPGAGRSRMAASATALAAGLLLAVFAIEPSIEHSTPLRTELAKAPDRLNPDQMAALYRMHDKIQAGVCDYPQALMLPPEQRAVYLENVVSGNGNDLVPGTLVLAQQLYQHVDCYYPPAAMLL